MFEPDAIHRILTEEILENVEKPAQYLGGEINMVRKPDAETDFRVALGFPDLYTVGMSHLGIQILYRILNDLPGVAAERVFTPWPDMAAALRARGIPLHTLESFTPVRSVDLFGLSLQYEILYTNVLEMLDLAGIPLRAADRGDDVPIVVGGGPGAFSPEPMAEYFDAFVVGDGEEAVVDLVNSLRASRGRPRRERLWLLAREVRGAYVPSFYQAQYGGDGRLVSFEPVEEGVPGRIVPAMVEDFDATPYPDRPIVPFVETIHDRITLEIMRGCVRGCRFCHAGMTRRPGRWKTVERLMALARTMYAATGHDEISLASLSTSDYPDLVRLLETMTAEFAPLHVGVSLSSLRVNDQLHQIPALAGSVRKSGLTLAVEASTERLRRVINKDISDENLFLAVQEAFRAGWNLVKLYFMIGLPTETAAEVDGIAAMAGRISRLRKEIGGAPARVNVSVSTFVPKPHTPFQWEPMLTAPEIEAHRSRLLSARVGRQVEMKFHNTQRSVLEGILSRGDRRLGRAVESAWRRGSVFDAWDEHFRFDRWLDALAEAGLGPAFYAHRRRDTDELLPWSHISSGIDPRFLIEEKERALREEWTPSCIEGSCPRCGACARGRRGAE